jgi:hypothetical protein
LKRKLLFDIRSANGWIIALGVAANLLWSFFILIIAFYALDVSGGTTEKVQVCVMKRTSTWRTLAASKIYGVDACAGW